MLLLNEDFRRHIRLGTDILHFETNLLAKELSQKADLRDAIIELGNLEEAYYEYFTFTGQQSAEARAGEEGGDDYYEYLTFTG